MEEGFIKQLMSAMKCSVCGALYRPANIKVLGHRDNLWFLSVSCHSCKSQGLVAAVIKEEGDIPGIITDLSKEEYSMLEGGSMVSGDDVLDMHQFLSEFDGDFNRVFKE